jgi:hypothetical protein
MITSVVNNYKVKPVDIPTVSTDNILGHQLFPSIFPNIFLCAKKKSGKTSVIFNIVEQCIDERTKVFLFSPTCDRDPTYVALQVRLRERGVPCITHDSILRGGESLIDVILHELRALDRVATITTSDNATTRHTLDFGPPASERQVAGVPVKPLAPLFLFIFDDISNDLRHRSVSTLLKCNRHYKAMCIISSQYLTDLTPASIKQLDYMLLFKSFSADKLEAIHRHLDLAVDLDKFIQMYTHATTPAYSFLYVNSREEEYRQNFDKKYLL